MSTVETDVKAMKEDIGEQLYSAAEDAKKWVELAREVSVSSRKKSSDNGTIVIIGSGIKGVSHFTLESIAEMKIADSLFYCASDPVSEIFIKTLRPDGLDLHVLYGTGKNRYPTYMQMSEFLLHEARKGKYVVGVFYGHPGVFVSPSHRSIKIAREEGIDARMLPAPSAACCLYADLKIDPASPGLMTMEATDVMLRDRTILLDRYAIIWQVGCVGDFGFRRTGYLKEKLSLLVERLQDIYGEDYEIINYVGAQYACCESQLHRVKLSEIFEPQNRRLVTGISTFCIPPKDQRQMSVNALMEVGLLKENTGMSELVKERNVARYTKRETDIIENLANWSVPEWFCHAKSSELSDKLTTLSINPLEQKEYWTSNKSGVLNGTIINKEPLSRNPEEIRKELEGPQST